MYEILNQIFSKKTPPESGGNLDNVDKTDTKPQGEMSVHNETAISADGNYWAIPALITLPDYSSESVVLVYKNIGGKLTFHQKVDPSLIPDIGMFWGYADNIAFSEDGDVLVLGYGSGAEYSNVFIYKMNEAGAYDHHSTISSIKMDYFGKGLALSPDAKTLLIGGHYNLDEYGTPGSVYVYEMNSAGDYELIQNIPGTGVDYNGNFGDSIAISDDGYTVAIAASARAVDDNQGTGTIYTYERTGEGGTFERVQQIIPDNYQGGEGFGARMRMSADGSTIVATSSMYEGTGTLRIFHRDTSGMYTFAQQLTPDDVNFNGGWTTFARDVAVSGDGSKIMLSYNEDRIEVFMRGVVSEFKLVDGAYTMTREFYGNTESFGDRFGETIALTPDSSVMVITASNETDMSGRVNAVYTFV